MRVGIASDHGGFILKEQIMKLLRETKHEVKDFGAFQLSAGDDYPDYVIPLAEAVAAGSVVRGIAVEWGRPSARTRLLVCARDSSMMCSLPIRALKTTT